MCLHSEPDSLNFCARHATRPAAQFERAALTAAMLASPVPVAPAPAGAQPLFGVCFLGKSYPIWDTVLTRVDATHWVSVQDWGLASDGRSGSFPNNPDGDVNQLPLVVCNQSQPCYGAIPLLQSRCVRACCERISSLVWLIPFSWPRYLQVLDVCSTVTLGYLDLKVAKGWRLGELPVKGHSD